MNKSIRTIEIRSAMNGYIVQVGCQTLVFASAPFLLSELNRYLAAPEDVEREYLDKFGGMTWEEHNGLRTQYTDVAAPGIRMDPRIHDAPLTVSGVEGALRDIQKDCR